MVEKNPLTANRPIYRTLPSQYSKFASSDYITDSGILVEYFEIIYNDWLSSLKAFLEYDGDLNVFTTDQLLALAPYFGFTEEFDPTPFERDTIIKLYQGVFAEPFIWRFRGSEPVFNYVIEAFKLEARISRPNAFIAGISKPGDICGSFANGIYKIIIPESYTLDSQEYAIVRYVSANFLPFYVKILSYENSDQPFINS